MLIVIAVCGCCVLEFQQFATNCNNTISVLQSIHQQTTKQTTKSKNKKTSKQPTKLNERQKEICNEVGLPTNVKQLNVGQRERLFRIEELLQHLDKVEKVVKAATATATGINRLHYEDLLLKIKKIKVVSKSL